MSDYVFEAVPVPARKASPGRPALPNPFSGQVAAMVDGEGNPIDTAFSFTVQHAPDSTAVGAIRRQLAKAGAESGVTVVKRIESTEDGSRVTFWTKPRITPQRKPREVASANGNGSAPQEIQAAATDGTQAAPAPVFSSGITTLAD